MPVSGRNIFLPALFFFCCCKFRYCQDVLMWKVNIFIKKYLHECLIPKDNYLIDYSGVHITRGPHKKRTLLLIDIQIFLFPVISYVCNSSKILVYFLSIKSKFIL